MKTTNRGVARFRLPLCFLVAGLMAVAAFGVGCGLAGGGDGDDEASAEIEAAVRAITEAWNGKDVEGLLALVSDNFIAEEFDGATREAAREELAQFIGEPPEEIIEISGIEVTGDTATAIREAKEGQQLTRERGTFVREGDEWKLDSVEDLGAEIPEGTTAVDLSLREYEFDFDEAAITSGDVAFNVTNDGGEQHVVFISKVPEDLDIEQALQSDEEPEGVEDVGGTDVLDPGDETTLVLAEPLAAGRYVMLCFVEAADGEPHALKGMWAEFTIE